MLISRQCNLGCCSGQECLSQLGFMEFECCLELYGVWTGFIGLKAWYNLFAAGTGEILRCCGIDVLADGVPESDCPHGLPHATEG